MGKMNVFEQRYLRINHVKTILLRHVKSLPDESEINEIGMSSRVTPDVI